MAISRGRIAAIKLMEDIGIQHPQELPLELIVAGRGAILIEEPMTKADGRIVHGKKHSIIKINSNIKYPGRRRFALAHELGHFEMHRDCLIHNDNSSLNWFHNAEAQLKHGKQEFEANQFASELLMPMGIFKVAAEYKLFGPQLLRDLAGQFQTSITSVAFRYYEANLHPIALFHIFNDKVSYWKKSDDLKAWVNDRTKLSPPEDSIAQEYIENAYRPIYPKEDLQQEISKSIWFKLWENEEDKTFYEYCIVSKNFRSILSVVWED